MTGGTMLLLVMRLLLCRAWGARWASSIRAHQVTCQVSRALRYIREPVTVAPARPRHLWRRVGMGTAAMTTATRFALAVLLAVGLALFGARLARAADESVSSIDVLSNRADLISGGDALVAVGLAKGTDPAS